MQREASLLLVRLPFLLGSLLIWFLSSFSFAAPTKDTSCPSTISAAKMSVAFTQGGDMMVIATCSDGGSLYAGTVRAALASMSKPGQEGWVTPQYTIFSKGTIYDTFGSSFNTVVQSNGNIQLLSMFCGSTTGVMTPTAFLSYKATWYTYQAALNNCPTDNGVGYSLLQAAVSKAITAGLTTDPQCDPTFCNPTPATPTDPTSGAPTDTGTSCNILDIPCNLKKLFIPSANTFNQLTTAFQTKLPFSLIAYLLNIQTTCTSSFPITLLGQATSVTMQWCNLIDWSAQTTLSSLVKFIGAAFGALYAARIARWI